MQAPWSAPTSSWSWQAPWPPSYRQLMPTQSPTPAKTSFLDPATASSLIPAIPTPATTSSLVLATTLFPILAISPSLVLATTSSQFPPSTQATTQQSQDDKMVLSQTEFVELQNGKVIIESCTIISTLY